MIAAGDTPKRTWIHKKWKHGGYACDRCQAVLTHENMLGEYSDRLFRVFGYWCPCGYEVRPAKKLVKFDWRRL